MDDITKIGIMAAIMVALLLGGLTLKPPTTVTADTEVVEVTEINVLPPKSLEMLDPVYSEKAIYADDTIRISFDVLYTEDGVKSELPFWLHNVSNEVIAIVWDHCSIQLPDGHTWNVIHYNKQYTIGVELSPITSIAPGGDLFESVAPVSEAVWTDEGWSLSSEVLDQGPFFFVLALEVSGQCDIRLIKYYTFRFIVR